jgi:hypothetical protein
VDAPPRGAFPWMLGAGPFAWRQSLALRRRIGRIAAIVAAALVLELILLACGSGLVLAALAGLVLSGWAVPALIRADLRRDAVMLAWLLALPCRGGAIVLGSTAPLTMAAWMAQVAAGAWIVAMSPSAWRAAWITLLVVLPLLQFARLCSLDAASLLAGAGLGPERIRRGVVFEMIVEIGVPLAAAPALAAALALSMIGLHAESLAIAVGWSVLLAGLAWAAASALVKAEPA